jgi:Cu(I)/Ag(I) efflux system membrane fusion protein
MRATNIVAIAVLAFSFPVYVAAQTHGEPSATPKTELQAHQGSGKVNKVDEKGSKVNVTHGPIESLGWPGMTMDIPVKNKADLAQVKPGQSVTFVLEKDTKGRYVITEIKPAEK